MAEIAKKTFEVLNNVKELDPAEDIITMSKEEGKALAEAKPWKDDPHYFRKVKISAIALIKMVIHARSGGQYEIMGVMNGKVRDHTFWVTDAFALPVQGTETRVNAGNEAMEYMVQFQMANEQAGRGDLLVGWYHSHPGYGCWLSGIDVTTQSTNQQWSDPYLAVVIDPNRTISAGKVEIGAFRTYPEGYTPPAAAASQYQSIPMDKIEDFGVHANAYYPLEVEVYKSKLDTELLDLLWNKYWIGTLSQSLVASNREYSTAQVKDLAVKLSVAGDSLHKGTNLKLREAPITGTTASGSENNDLEYGDNGKDKGKDFSSDFHGVDEEETALDKATQDGIRISTEAQHGMIAQEIKAALFNVDLNVTPPDLRAGKTSA